jgi:NAD+ kinase
VLLLSDPRDARASGEVGRVRAWLEARKVKVAQASVGESPAHRADLILVLGGDGAFLRAVLAAGDGEVPFLGIRYGTFGYLAELEPGTWEAELERLLAGEGRIESWMRLRCTLRDASGTTESAGLALNEAILTAAEVARMLEVQIRIDDEDVTRYRGDGLIVATPVGSTGHSLAAGGPIVEPTDRCLILTPIASQAMTYRPLVLREHRRVQLLVLGARHGAALTMDGRGTRRLELGSAVEITASDQDVPVATVVRRSRFRTLRERLHWGAPLVHEQEPDEDGAQS